MNVIEATGLKKRFGTPKPSMGSTWQRVKAASSACSAPTAPARRPPYACSPPCCSPTPAPPGSAATTSWKRAQKVRNTVGLTGQYASVNEDLTGTQNLVMIGQLLNLSTRQAKARAAELLAWFDLSAAANKMAKTYSGGMEQPTGSWPPASSADLR